MWCLEIILSTNVHQSVNFDIRVHILPTILPMVLMRRVCVTIRTFFHCWSRPFSHDLCVLPEGEMNVGHSWWFLKRAKLSNFGIGWHLLVCQWWGAHLGLWYCGFKVFSSDISVIYILVCVSAVSSSSVVCCFFLILLADVIQQKKILHGIILFICALLFISLFADLYFLFIVS